MIGFSSVSLQLNRALGKLGTFVARYPKWIITLSIASSFLLGLGVIKAELRTDFERTFAPVGCRSYEEQRVVSELFPTNTSYNYDYLRVAKRGRYAAAIVSSKDKQTVLRKSIFTEIAAFDEMVRSIEVEWGGTPYTYADICAKNNGRCDYSEALNYLDRISQIEEKKIYIKYPVEIDLDRISMNISAMDFGGVRTDGTKNIVDAKAMRLLYVLDNSNKEIEEISLKWEEKFRERISEHESNLTRITTFVSSDYERFGKEILIQIFSYGSFGIAVTVIFCALSSMTSDWVTSKPFLASAGCFSPFLAILGSIGLTAIFGVKFTFVNMIIIFLIIGIGVDDMFILISAWRATDSKDKVVNRLSDAYSHAATPIVMSSLTSFIAFSVGITVPIPAIRICCIQASIAVVLDFIYQITFFGGCMALDGYREENKLHPLTFKPVISRKEAGDRSCLYQIFFTDKEKIDNNSRSLLTVWFSDKLCVWVSKTPFIIAIIILFTIYLAAASLGSTSLRKGVDFSDIFLRDSEEHAFGNDLENYFTEYSYPIQLVLNATLDYSNRKVRRTILRSINRFHQSNLIQKQDFNWLKHYLFVLQYNRTYSTLYNLTDPREFINCLRNEFFNHPLGKQYRHDVKFHEDGKRITASRFVFIAKGSLQSSNQRKLIEQMRGKADSLPFPATVQSIWWLQCELLFQVEKLTTQSIGVSLAGILLVLTLFCSSLSSAFIVMAVVMSIEFGIVGNMSFLGVTLNPISLMILTFCVGLSIDPCTHVSYAYRESRGTYREKLQRTLNIAGIPVFQGSFSTILAVLSMSFIPHYIGAVLVRLIGLLAILSFLHAIFLLPLLHHFWDVITQFITKARKQVEKERCRPSTPQLIKVISNGSISQA